LNAENQLQLPQALQRQFAELERRLWKTETALAIAIGAAGLLVSFLLLFFSDRLWTTPVWLRIALVGLGLASAVASAFFWCLRWVWNRRDWKKLSLLVQARYRRLGDRLLGIVELADVSRRPAYFSPALYEAAIHQVADAAAPLDFPAAVETRTARRISWAVALLCSFALALGLLAPAALWNAFLRWVGPTAAVPRYTFVTIEDLPEKQIVPHGEPFELAGRIRYHSFWRPNRALAQINGQPKLAASIHKDSVHFRLPGQVEKGVLTIRVGDAVREVQIDPVHRPSLEMLAASVDLPQYLGYPAETNKIQNASLKLLEGSQIAFAGKISRELASAHLNWGNTNRDLKVDRDIFESAKFSLAAPEEAAFSWTDKFGLRGTSPWRLSLETIQDAPPRPELSGLPRESAVLETEVLDVRVLAEDDYGVKTAGVRWSYSARGDSNAPPARPFQIEPDDSRQRHVADSFYFSPSLLGVPADATVELKAFATDYFPGRAPVESVAYHIQVLGLEQHAEMVRQKLESLMVRLEEITRLEEKIQSETRQAKDQENAPEAQTRENLQKTELDQLQNARELEEIAREGMKTLRQALRNPAFNEQALGQWSKQMGQMQKLSQNQMAKAAKQLRSAQQKKSDRSQELSEAIQKEQEILEQLAQMQKQSNQDLDALEALTLAQRLRKLGGEEKDLQQHLQRIVPETIGLLPQELPEPFRQANQRFAGGQQETQKRTETLQGEISRYFERTRRESYGQVSQAMAAAHASEELDRLRELIQSNIGMQSIQNLELWSDQFSKWADLLEPKPASNAGAGNGQGAPQGAEESLLKELLGLLRLRERELNLREQTRLLDQQKSDAAIYPDRAGKLFGQQSKILTDLDPVKEGAEKLPVLRGAVEEAGDHMSAAAELLKQPQTDQATTGKETAAIQSLTDAINIINEEAKKKSNSQGQSAAGQELAMLIQMMAAQAQPKPGQAQPSAGGNPSGGGTDGSPSQVSGNAEGGQGEGRAVKRSSGFFQNPPAEFREALENYYRAVEQKHD